MDSKSHIRKAQLRRTTVIFQVLEIAYRRVLNLAGITFLGEEASAKLIWSFLRQARRDYEDLRLALSERMGSAVRVSLPDMETDRGFEAVLLHESTLREEMVKLIRGIEVFDEERELTHELAAIRKNLLEARKQMKHFTLNRPADLIRAPLLKVGE